VLLISYLFIFTLFSTNNNLLPCEPNPLPFFHFTPAKSVLLSRFRTFFSCSLWVLNIARVGQTFVFFVPVPVVVSISTSSQHYQRKYYHTQSRSFPSSCPTPLVVVPAIDLGLRSKKDQRSHRIPFSVPSSFRKSSKSCRTSST